MGELKHPSDKIFIDYMIVSNTLKNIREDAVVADFKYYLVVI